MDVLPAYEFVLFGQLTHCAALAPLYLAAGHSTHALAAEAPGSADALPAVHPTHVPGPEATLNVPASHTAHASVAGMRYPFTSTSDKNT